MKKFLSLMLAMIMVMSLVTVGAGATFTDAEEIQYVEAVELMSGLGILEGPGDGSFNPKGNLSRAAAAKIIAYIALGAKAADVMTYDKVIFPDVELTSSTAPYIAWCYENGIIDGHTDGTFRRTNNVTGHAFLKMVLNALGVYGQYTGTGWQTVATANANEKGLLEGLSEDVVLSQPLTREAACQIAFNAMSVERDVKKGYVVGGEWFEKLSEAVEYATYMKIEKTPMFVAATSGTLLDKVHGVKATTAAFVEKNSANTDTKLTYVDGKWFGVETDLSLLGSYVKFYYKANNTSTYADKGHTFVSGVEYGTEVTVTGATTAAELKAALAAVGITEKVAANTTLPALNADGTVGTFELKEIKPGTTTGKTLVGEGNTVKLIVVNEIENEGTADEKVVAKIKGAKEEMAKKLDKIESITTTADKQKVDFVIAAEQDNGVKTTTAGVTTVSDKVREYEDMAKGDYVVITQIGDIYNLEKAQTVTGKPTKIDGTTVTINGVAYAQKGTTDATALKLAAGALSLTKEVTLFLDGQGNYIYAATIEDVDVNIVYVVDTYEVPVDGKANGVDANGFPVGKTEDHKTYFAQVVTMDGEKAIYPITTEMYGKVTEDTLYKMTVDTTAKEDKAQVVAKNGTDDTSKWTYVKTKFASFTTAVAAEDELFIGATTTNEVKTTSIKLNQAYYIADDVTFMWISGDQAKLKLTVKEGVQALANGTAVKVVYEKDEAGNKLVAYVIIETEFKADTVYTGDIVYVVADATSSKQVATYVDGTTTKIAYEHEVYVNGVKTPVTLTKEEQSITSGFYKLAEKVAGVNKLDTTDVAKITIDDADFTMFKTLITIDGVKAEDIDVTGVKVVDLRTGTDITKVTDATKLDPTASYSISVVFEKAYATSATNTIKTIYVW